MSKIREGQDRLTVIILDELEKRDLRREELMKLTLMSCGSRSKFNKIMFYLLQHRFIIKRGRKGGRGPYVITEKGKLQLSILRNQT